MRDQPDRGLDEDEREREPHQQRVAAGPALVGVDQHRGTSRGHDPRREAAELQTRIEGPERDEALAQEARQPREEDSPKRGPSQAALVLLFNRSSCC